MRKALIIILVVIVLVLLLLWLGSGYTFMKYAFKRKDKMPEKMMPTAGTTPEEQNRAEIIKTNRRKFNETINAWLPGEKQEELVIRAENKYDLHGLLVRPENESHDYAILCHGYMGNRSWMYPYAYVYNKWGWNTLVLDMRSHGASDGKWMGMGWKDKDDVLLWIQKIIEMDPEARIILHGVSMGGATVMMASGLELPSNVKGIIADCGYTSVWEVFNEQVALQNNIKPGPILSSADLLNRMINGWSMKDASSIEQLKKADPDLPILFVQGEDDAFVLKHMIEENHAAKRGLKEMKVFPDTDHGNSVMRWPEEYLHTARNSVALSAKCRTLRQ